MKSLLLLLSLAFVGNNYSVQPSQVKLALETVSQQMLISDLLLNSRNLIRWRVGEFHEMKVDMGGFIKGDGRKEVTKEEMYQGEEAIWYVTTINIMGQSQVSEALMKRSDGSVVKLIVNGKEQTPPSQDDMDIIEQSETTVTVPAGTFDCLYIKVKTKSQGQDVEIEAWANPIDVNLDGMLKTKAKTSIMPIKMELVKFGS